MGYFVYRLIPPRPTFDRDQTPAEAAVMTEHFGYWREQLQTGRVVIYGPVLDPHGAWGLAVVEADTQADVDDLGRTDPAVSSGIATYQVMPMATAIVRAAT